MNSPIAIFHPPNPIPEPMSLREFHEVTDHVKRLARWSTSFTKSMNDTMGRIINQLNTQVQGVGADVASATTIAISSVMQRVTGTVAIQTITPPPNFSGPIFLIARDGFSFVTGGNIANAVAVPANALATLVYTPQFNLWWVTSVAVADGSITTAKLADGAVVTVKLGSGAVTTVKLDSGAVTTPKLGAGAANEGTPTVDNTSQSITPYDTPVTVVSETISVDAISDFVHISGRIIATGANIQSLDSGQAFLYRGATLLDTAPMQLTLSTATTVGGQATAAFNYYDTGISGPQTYSVKLQIHNGSGNATFTLTKDSAALLIVDNKAQ